MLLLIALEFLRFAEIRTECALGAHAPMQPQARAVLYSEASDSMPSAAPGLTTRAIYRSAVHVN